MKRYFFLVLSALCLPVYAQITVSDFLLSAWSDPDVKMYDEQLRYLSTRPYQLSPLQRLEFRTQNRELDPDQQEFALRLTPSNPWEVRNNNNFFKAYRSSTELQREMAVMNALEARYRATVLAAYHYEMRELSRASRRMIREQLMILQEQTGSKFFDADDFVDLQLDLMDRTVDEDEAGFNVSDQLRRVGAMHGKPLDSVSWRMRDLPDPGRVMFVADSLSAIRATPVLLGYRQQKIDLAESEYKLERSNINAGFLQAEYDNRRREQGRTPVNISLGITIPVVNPNKGDMSMRKLDMIEAKYDLENAITDEAQRIEGLKQRLSSLAGQHITVVNKIRDYEKGGLGNLMSIMEDGDPRIAVRFNGNINKLKMLAARIRRDVLLAYIDYLYAIGRLQQEPLTNYLTVDLAPLK